MKLDIVIPFYKNEELLKRALKSIYCQIDSHNFLNAIYVILDGNYEENKYVANDILFECDTNIKLIPILLPENRGVGNARQVGLNNVTADYVMFIDSDDYLMFNSLDRIYEKLEKSCWPNCYSGNFFSYSSENSYTIIPNLNTTWFHGRVYKLEAIKQRGMFIPDVRMNEDAGFNMAFFELTHSVVRDDVVVYCRTYNKDSLCRDEKNNKYTEFFHSVFLGLTMIDKSVFFGWKTVDIVPRMINQLYFFINEIPKETQLYKDSLYYFVRILSLIDYKNLFDDDFLAALCSEWESDERNSGEKTFEKVTQEIYEIAESDV